MRFLKKERNKVKGRGKEGRKERKWERRKEEEIGGRKEGKMKRKR